MKQGLPGLLLLSIMLSACSLSQWSESLNNETFVMLPDDAAVTITDSEEQYVSSLPNYGPAPELYNEVWLNTDAPLQLAGLRGKVVLLEMWTFDCINCIHVIPSVRAWHETYSEQGLVVIGNHYPEFGYEHDLGNLRAAMTRLDVPYAVTQDNDGATWRAYNNRYWPALYLIDKQGNVRYSHFGEGRYTQTEAAIQELLRETYIPPAEAIRPEQRPSLTATTTLNVRSGPGTDYGQIGSIDPGEIFIIRGEQNGWYIIKYNDADGYISGEYVSLLTS